MTALGEAPAERLAVWRPAARERRRPARLSSAFTETARLLRLLAADGFTGTVELVGREGRRDSVLFLEGVCIASSVAHGERRMLLPLRLPGPEYGPVVQVSMRAQAATLVIAHGLALRTPARLAGLGAAFLSLPGLIASLARRGRDAAVIVSAPGSAGVVLISGGEAIAAYGRRQGERPGEIAETTDLAAVEDLVDGGVGEIDVHDGPLVAPLDLERLIASATPG